MLLIDGIRIFIPASLVSDVYEKDLGKYEGQEISFVLIEYNPKKRRYIGDRKQLLVKEKAAEGRLCLRESMKVMLSKEPLRTLPISVHSLISAELTDFYIFPK